ncbi:MAG: hypothetical protein ABFS14_09850 [Gemmatimonadota bacterium]
MKAVVKTLFAAVAFSAAGCASSNVPGPAADANAEQTVDLPAAEAAVPSDPRVGLSAGWSDAGVAVDGMELVAHLNRPEGFEDRENLGSFAFANTDIAFAGDHLFMGSYRGFNIYDISNPLQPRVTTSFVCPGGQGDLSVHGNLMFMSVEAPNGRLDCGEDAPTESVSAERFRGVRIFDISDIENPQQVGGVQTCRGSHTHTLVLDPDDDSHVYIYVQGTGGVRPAEELAGCTSGAPDEDPNTALFRIEIIEVPLAAPAEARIVNAPRIFADAETGAIAGLWPGGEHGEGSQTTSTTNQCHDITVYQELGLAAGACSGNGILLDISDPANPVRIDEVMDPNFAYWHSATFSNDGSTVLFTDEWGGGGAPRCLATDKPEWGANAFFDRSSGKMEFTGYFKLPAAQTAQENCVAHNGSLIPVPGRDIFVQAWYQGGISVIDFTDPTNPMEMAYFDRGPNVASELVLGGFWSTYWYNGAIYGSEILRGLDVFQLTPGEYLTQNEIDAANLVQVDVFNPQTQTRITWPQDLVVARALMDQLQRHSDLPAGAVDGLAGELSRIGELSGADQTAGMAGLAAAVGDLSGSAEAGSPDARRLELLRETLGG